MMTKLDEKVDVLRRDVTVTVIDVKEFVKGLKFKIDAHETKNDKKMAKLAAEFDIMRNKMDNEDNVAREVANSGDSNEMLYSHVLKR